MMYINMIQFGDPRGLHDLNQIISENPNSEKSQLAKKVIEIKENDYRQYFEKELGTELDKYLDYLKISAEIRNNKEELIKTLIKIILKKDQMLHEIVVGIMSLEKLGIKDIDVFEIDKVKELSKKYN